MRAFFFCRSVLVAIVASVALASAQLTVIAQPAGADTPAQFSVVPTTKCVRDPISGKIKNTNDVITISSQRCVAEKVHRTRGSIRPDCFGANELELAHTYEIGECKGKVTAQPEALAQARIITRINADGVAGPSALLTQISPNIQWETRYDPGPRLDVLVYDREDVTQPIQIIEAKKKYSPQTLVDAAGQLRDYLRDFPSGPESRNKIGFNLNNYNNAGPYSDNFTLHQKCGGGKKDEITTNYSVYPGAVDGLLVVDPIHETKKPCKSSPTPTVATGTRTISTSASSSKPTEVPKEHACEKAGSLQGACEEAVETAAATAIYVKEHPVLVGTAVGTAMVGVAVVAALEVCAATVVCLGAVAAVLAVIAVGLLAEKLLDDIRHVAQYASPAAIYNGLKTLFGALTSWNLFGDPHLATLDGAAYDMQSVGEFHLLEAPDADLDAQARFVASGPNVSSFGAMAVQVGDARVELGSQLKINGKPIALADTGGTISLGDGAYVLRLDDHRYAIVWPGETDRPMMVWNGGTAGFHIPKGMATRGLLGNNNEDPDDDFRLNDDTTLAAPITPGVLHGQFADSWRVTDDESLFDYDSGESTSTFTDKSFPSDVQTVADFSETEVSLASEACQRADVRPGPQFDACVYDVLVTGDDRYVESAAGVTQVLVDPEAHAFDDAGQLAEDFEGTVGSNFGAPRYFTDSTTSRMAGPLFDTPGYMVTARTIGRHKSVRLRAKLFAFGNIGDDDRPQSVELTANGSSAGEISFEGPAGPELRGGLTGTLERTGVNLTTSGVPYTEYVLDATLQHSDESLDLQFAPKNFRGGLGTSLGIDDIQMTLEVPQANAFDVSLPLRVPSAQAEASHGAGDIEVQGGQDNYQFVLDHPTALVMQTRSCGTSLSVTAVNATTNERTKIHSGCGDALSPVLREGAYRLEVFGRTAGSYVLDLDEKPAPDHFDLGNLDAHVVISDGAPAPGAGNLETALSRDDYDFVVSGTSTLAFTFETVSSSNLNWVLLGPAGPVRSGDGRGRIVGLAPGPYTLRVGDTENFGAKGAYRLELITDQPQTFDLGSLSAPAHLVSTDIPASGAGQLETLASTDNYPLIVPTTGSIELSWDCADTFGYLDWSLLDAAGTAVASDTDCYSRILKNLTPGEYTLSVQPAWGIVGSYKTTIGMVPPAQDFDLGTLSDQRKLVQADEPGPGAGTLEYGSSVDKYQFELSQPQSLAVMLNGPASNAQVRLIGADGQLIASFTRETRIDDLPAGGYALVVGNEDYPEFAGSYDMTLDAAATQSFELGALGDPQQLVRGDFPATGAGRLESLAATDLYNLAITEDGSITLEWTCSSAMAWSLVREDGTTFQSGISCSDSVIKSVPAGTYRLRVAPTATATSYSLVIGMVPPADIFQLDSLDSHTGISDGNPSPHAGNLEYRTSRDEYQFTIDATQTFVANAGESESSPIMTLYDEYGDVVTRFRGTTRIETLYAGDYRLVVGNGESPDRDGPYHLNIDLAKRQTFDLGVLGAPHHSISDGLPALGAGHLESVAATDVYTLTVPATGAIQMDWLCDSGWDALKWTLTKVSASAEPIYTRDCRDAILQDIPAGDYRLAVFPGDQDASAYDVTIGMVPDAQVFELGTLSDAAAISDNQPSVGAGRLEYRTSRDEYRFRLATKTPLYVDLNFTEAHPTAELIGPNGTFITRVRDSARIPNLMPGSYRLIVSKYFETDRHGAYGLTLSPNAVQTFDLGAMAEPRSVGQDLGSTSGAQRLESRTAEDDYLFTLPTAGGIEVTWDCGDTFGMLDSAILGPDGQVFEDIGCWNRGFVDLPAGQYRLTVQSSLGFVGEYGLSLGVIPDAQVFDLGDLSDAASVQPDVPDDGAGRLEYGSSRDVYEFTLTSASTLGLDFPEQFDSVEGRLVDATGSSVAVFGQSRAFRDLAAGNYRLIVGDQQRLQAPTAYRFTLSKVTPQGFELGVIGEPTRMIADQVPASGAGRLESIASVDKYTLSLAASSSIEMDWSCDGTGGYLEWALRAADGSRVASNLNSALLQPQGRCDDRVLSLPAGSYSITVSEAGDVGDYSLVMGVVPDAQTFSLGTLTARVAISDGLPSAGAGNLEYRTSQDEYSFVVSRRQNVSIDFVSSRQGLFAALYGANGLVATIEDHTDLAHLPVGEYRLVVGDRERVGVAGTYELSVAPSLQAAYDLGTLGDPGQLISAGVPAAGAGTLESVSESDTYSFTVPETGDVRYSWDCNGMFGMLDWTIKDLDDTTVVSGQDCDSSTVRLSQGAYVLSVTPVNGLLGDYSLSLGMAPTNEDSGGDHFFQLGVLGDPALLVDNQMPGPGAGHLGTEDESDVYEFTVPSSRVVEMTWDCSSSDFFGGIMWQLDGSHQASVDFGWTCRGGLPVTMPDGTYRLTVRANGSVPIDYALTIGMVPAPQQFDLGMLSSSESPGAPMASVRPDLPLTGAGMLEFASSRDEYQFSLGEPQTLFLDFSPSESNTPPVELQSSDGEVLGSYWGSTRLPRLGTGNYRLLVGGTYSFGESGPYGFDLVQAPAAESFDLGPLGGAPSTLVSDQVPGIGAGNLENLASADEYTFSLNETANVGLGWACDDIFGTLTWELLDSTGSSVASDTYCGNRMVSQLPAGQYKLVILPEYGIIGPYSISIGILPDTEQFHLGQIEGQLLVSDGQPAPGAGNIEYAGWHDDYTFTVGARKSVSFSLQSAEPWLSATARIVGDDGETITSFDGAGQLVLEPGTYHVVVGFDAYPVALTYELTVDVAAAESTEPE